jgi:hypothetical protein
MNPEAEISFTSPAALANDHLNPDGNSHQKKTE